MAGEWIAYDLAMPSKPEVQELIDITGEPVEVVVYRLLQLWGWASMHCADGMAKMTPPRLVRTCGGTIEFWRAVESVGWLEIDETTATVAVPGWDRRFSQAAKSRAQHSDRSRAQDERNPDRRRRAGVACAQAQPAAAPERSRGEEIRIEDPPPPRVGFAELREAWNRGPGRRWTPHKPPAGAEDRLAEPGWFTSAVEAIERLRVAKFFKTPPTLIQFIGDGFVERVLGGQYDAAKTEKGGFTGGKPGSTDYRPPAEWTGDDAARFEATKRRELERLARAAAS
jgi:hypothetical protein